jgi:hypothetical protein
MSIRTYQQFDLLVDNAVTGEGADDALRSFAVQVLDSPAGGGDPVPREVPPELAAQLATILEGLDERAIDADGVIGLGEALADLLLPDPVRDLLVRSMDRLAANEGLRLRLRLDPLLADIPWEYAFVPRQAGQRDATGFLALDPRVSIVRHQAAAGPLPDARPAGQRRVVAGLASPKAEGIQELDLDDERRVIEQALGDVTGLVTTFVDHATIERLSRELAAGTTDVFHFAGHGVPDAIVLESDDADAPDGGKAMGGKATGGAPVRLSAEQLGVNLLGQGAQLAVLGACDSGRRDQADAWSGVATELIGAGVPAVVAMQYKIGDRNAIDFGQAFYRSLAAGLPVDAAVAAGRLAVFNRMEPLKAQPRRAGFWRDWGVPVLYLRSGATVDLTAIPNVVERADAAQEAALFVDQRIRRLRPAGKYTGAEVGVVQAGRIDVKVKAELVEGSLVGARIERVEAGKVDVKLDLGDVEGEVVGVKVGTIGGRAGAAGRVIAPIPDEEED